MYLAISCRVFASSASGCDPFSAPTLFRALAKLMYDELQSGSVPDQVRETRPEWNDRDYHYDFRLSWSGRNIYVETILLDDDPTDPTVYIVSIHDA